MTEEGRFASLVREIGHSIATEYSLTYRTPRPIEDGTDRTVELKVTYNGQTASATTSYQVHGVGGATINVPDRRRCGRGREPGRHGSAAVVVQLVEPGGAPDRDHGAVRSLADALRPLGRRAEGDRRGAEPARAAARRRARSGDRAARSSGAHRFLDAGSSVGLDGGA